MDKTNGLAQSDEQSVICLAAHSAVDRHAYRLLLLHALRIDIQLECSFAAVSVWDAIRGDPHVVILFADAVTQELRDTMQTIPRMGKRAKILAVALAPGSGGWRAWGDCSLSGFVLKSADVEEIGQAIAAIVAGREHFSPEARQAFSTARVRNSASASLSRRETELLPLIARGLTLREAARQMTVSYKTADSYRTSLLRKLGIHDRVELARYAIRERIIEA